MGRLFWKFIFAFWLAFAAIAGTIATTFWLIHQTESIEQKAPWHGQPMGPAGFMLDTATSILEHGSVDTLRSTLSVWQRSPEGSMLYVLDERGHELTGRVAPAVPDGDGGMVRKVKGADGHVYTLFPSFDRPAPPLGMQGGPGDALHPPPGPGMQGDPGDAPHNPQGGPPRPSPIVPILSALFVSLGFSAWLAWYFAKPIRILRAAFHSAAEGKLETRVQPLMGRRRDEIADLGRDFDRMARQLQKQMGAQQRLLHDVSHELRSPLARLQAAVGLARQNPRRIDMTLSRIEHESTRLDALVSEVLTLARLETGINGLPSDQVDLVELLTMIVDDAQFEARLLSRDVNLIGEGAFVLECKAELLYRSFENVIRNAVKYTADNTTVDVTVQTSLSALQVTVADHGPGVQSENLDSIFEPFYRADNHCAVEGYGLGLAIARRAVESHAGKIWAERGRDDGLIVHIVIPRSVTPQAAVCVPASCC